MYSETNTKKNIQKCKLLVYLNTRNLIKIVLN